MEHFDFPIREETAKAIVDMGYEAPTPIQEMTIPPLLEGRDVIGQAQTGTGKTAAFGIPMIERVNAEERTVQGLVLCPTRELAMQTAGEITKLAKYRPGLSVLAVYGGQPIERQLRPLKMGVQVVVGTPGRVLDHINRGTLSLSDVKFAVLDEADEMLDMGFREDIESILSQTNEDRQTALFSATMPFPILSLAQKYLKEPENLRVEMKGMTVEAVEQTYIPIRSFHKVELLSRLLVRDDVTRALVFMNTKLGVEEVVTKLQARGFAAAGLHGDMRQIERDAIMERFKNGMVGILVATDVAARGLDIENVEAVFNYDIPLDVENYVHRIGRTGRAGKDGRAYTFVVGRETSRMWDYRKVTKAAILCEQPPSGDDIRFAQEERMLTKAREKAEGELGERLLATAKKLLETTPAETAVAALIQMLEEAMGDKIDPALDIRIPEPPKPAPKPLPARTPYGNRGGRALPARRGGRFEGPYGRPADEKQSGNNRRYGRPAFPGDENRRYGKPAFVTDEARPYGKPAEEAGERRYGKPAFVNDEARPYGKPAEEAGERRYGKSAFVNDEARSYGKPAHENRAEGDKPAREHVGERRYGRPVPESMKENSDRRDSRRYDSADSTPHKENRFERRRRQFGELPAVEAPTSGSEKTENTKPYRPWADAPHSRNHRGRDGAINAKDSLPRYRDEHGKKPRKG